jgi:hypothetical protein
VVDASARLEEVKKQVEDILKEICF